MKQCHSCSGLVPDSISTCPHCSAVEERSENPRNGVMTKLAAITGAGLISVTLQACYGLPPQTCPYDLVDADGDGYLACFNPATGQISFDDHYQVWADLPEPDCDDSDPNSYPGAPDTPQDGIDQNCDRADGIWGAEDSQPITPTVYRCTNLNATDFDGDGFGVCVGDTPAWAEGLPMQPYGKQPDCNDADASIRPDAFDYVGDGVDSDCDGLDGISE